jgi:excisionase family DNA binding protein
MTTRQPAQPQTDGWLDMGQAAAYLGLTRNALRKYTAARTIPFEQDIPGAKCWFKRCELDAWRRGESFQLEAPSRAPASKTLPNRQSEKQSF